MPKKIRWFKKPIYGFTHSRFVEVTSIPNRPHKASEVKIRKKYVRYF